MSKRRRTATISLREGKKMARDIEWTLPPQMQENAPASLNEQPPTRKLSKAETKRGKDVADLDKKIAVQIRKKEQAEQTLAYLRYERSKLIL